MNLTFPGGGGSARILGASAVAVSGAADTAENILGTVTIPAGAMGVNGILRVEALWTVTNSANNKTLRVRLGGIGGTQFIGNVVTTVATARALVSIANRGAANSQISMANSFNTMWGSTTNAVTTAAIDTSAATTIVITGQKASAGETLTLESYLVELILP